MADVAFRTAEQSDLNFILQSWVRSYAPHERRWPRVLPRKLLAPTIRDAILELLTRPNVRIVMAVCPLNPDLIWGWVVYEVGHNVPVLHYVYVKELFRGMDIGTDLVARARESAGVLHYTYRTPACNRFLEGAIHAPQYAQRTL